MDQRAPAGVLASAVFIVVLAVLVALPGSVRHSDAQVVGTGPVASTFHMSQHQVGVLMAGSGEVHPSQGRRFGVTVYLADALCGPGSTVREWRADNGTIPWPVVGNSGCVPPLPDPPPPIADLLAAAARAIPRPAVLVDPTVRGLVGLDTYFWYEGETDVVAAAVIGGFTGTAAASAVSFTWHDGDAHLGTALQPGTRSDPAVTSLFVEHGVKPLTLNVAWHGVGAVTDGVTIWLVDLGTITTASDVRDYDVPEAQALITR